MVVIFEKLLFVDAKSAMLSVEARDVSTEAHHAIWHI